MHIALVAPEFPPEIGGMQTYALEFAEELLRRGHRLTVFTRRRREAQAQLPGAEVRGVLTGRAGPDWAQMRGLQADAWHVMNAAYAWVALRRQPCVVSIHGNDFLRPYIPVGEPDLSWLPGAWRINSLRLAVQQRIGAWRTPRLVRAGLQRATRILSNSRYTQQVFLAHFPECAPHTSTALVGVGARYLTLPPRAPSPAGAVPQLVTICRLSERRKNVDRVLRALARLAPTHDFRYTIVGDGDARPELEALAQSLGLAGRVRFTGFLSQPDMQQVLAASDLFVLVASINPGSHEGFGIVYLEANAWGVPTLAARLAGAAEAVEEGVSGHFTDGVEEADIAAALARFLEGRWRIAPADCQAFARRFGWDQVVEHALPWYGQAGARAMTPALSQDGG